MIRGERMLFQVTRTSSWYDDKPYDKCIPIKLTIVDRRTFKTPEEHDARCAEHSSKWFDVGTNHRVENGFIVRDLDTKDVWGIEINSLEELMAFQAEVGEELIIGTSYTDNKFPLIEIYDSYRE
jgi:hypothetical protein